MAKGRVSIDPDETQPTDDSLVDVAMIRRIGR